MSEVSLKKNNSGREFGPLVIVAPKNLPPEGVKTPVAEGIYEGTTERPAGVSASGKKYPASTEYRIRGAGDTLYILKDTQALREQLGQLTPEMGANVNVYFHGKKTTKSGKDYYDFEVKLKNV